MTQPDSTPIMTASAFRQLLTAATDAGLRAVLSTESVRNEGTGVVITVSRRQVRALTNWLTIIADRHRDCPITATTIPGITASNPIDDQWMTEVADFNRSIPAGYARAHIPSVASNVENPK